MKLLIDLAKIGAATTVATHGISKIEPFTNAAASVLNTYIISNNPPSNCKTVITNTQGKDSGRKSYDCSSQISLVQEKNTLKELHSLTELDLEKLFVAGEHTINEKQSLELKRQHPIFQLLAQQNSTVYILGSADKAGDTSFSRSLSNDTCISPGLNQIQLHASTGGSYERKLSSRNIPSPFTNFDLPQLRARSFQCWVKREYPTISTEILEGDVQSAISPQYRRVRVFTDKKIITSQLLSFPSSD
jgi:hypothetical protein